MYSAMPVPPFATIATYAASAKSSPYVIDSPNASDGASCVWETYALTLKCGRVYSFFLQCIISPTRVHIVDAECTEYKV